MKKWIVFGMFAGVLLAAESARAGGFISVGLPGLSVQVGRGVHVQAGPVAVGVGLPCPPRVVYAPPPVVYAPAPVVCAPPVVQVRPARVHPRHHVVVSVPPPFVVYSGPYPPHIAPPYGR
jgi:hypothetical protein